MLVFFFFFSSRRRHTRLVSDWSSDVCSSDLYSNFFILTLVFEVECTSRDRDFLGHDIGDQSTQKKIKKMRRVDRKSVV